LPAFRVRVDADGDLSVDAGSLIEDVSELWTRDD
jgi:hypothetical protein